MTNLNYDKELLQDIFNYLQPYCIAIYLGGSSCQKYIKNIHDIDFICFANEPINMCHIRRLLNWYSRNHEIPNNYDFIQVRTKQSEEHAYGSYINKLMVKVIGEDIEFKFDIINKDKEEYLKIIGKTIENLQNGVISNQKRWYQVYQGLCIIKNKSYELTSEQIEKLNILHDLSSGYEKIVEETLNLYKLIILV